MNIFEGEKRKKENLVWPHSAVRVKFISQQAMTNNLKYADDI